MASLLILLGLHFVRYTASCILAETPTQFIRICGPKNACSTELDMDFPSYLDDHCTTCTDKCKSLLAQRTCAPMGQKETAALNTALATCSMPPVPDCSPDHDGVIHLKDCVSGALNRIGVSPLTVTSTTAANFYFCITKPLLVPECTLQVTIGSQSFTPKTTFCAPSSANMQASHSIDTVNNNTNMEHNSTNMDNSNTVGDSNHQTDHSQMNMNNNGNGGTDGGMSDHMGINRNLEEFPIVQSKFHTTSSHNTVDTNSTPMKMDMSTQQQTANSNTNSIQLEISTSCGLTYFVSRQSEHTSGSVQSNGHTVTDGGMDVWFHSNINSTVLWQWWRPQTSPAFVLSNITVFIFALSVHFITYSMKICTTRRNKKLKAGVMALIQPPQAQEKAERTTCSSTTIIYFLLQGFGFTLNYTLGMFIMLIIMTMNVWYFVSIVIGNTVGYGITTWMSERQSHQNETNQFHGDEQSAVSHC